jgi:hypothetical protein
VPIAVLAGAESLSFEEYFNHSARSRRYVSESVAPRRLRQRLMPDHQA